MKGGGRGWDGISHGAVCHGSSVLKDELAQCGISIHLVKGQRMPERLDSRVRSRKGQGLTHQHADTSDCIPVRIMTIRWRMYGEDRSRTILRQTRS